MKIATSIVALMSTIASFAAAADVNDLFSIRGTDPPVEQLLERGSIVVGQRFGKGPVPGARVAVNHQRLRRLTGRLPALDTRNIAGIQHQAGHGSRREIGNWGRFYQEDGITQVFRLHKGDWQFRDPSPAQARAGRIEAYTRSLAVEPGTWMEWEGTYTLIKPHSAVIFQLFHEGDQLWAFHLNVNDNGDITFNRRRNQAGKEKRITLARDMIGKPLSIKVRSNAHDFQLFMKQPLVDRDWKLVTDGRYQRGKDNKIQFRWGMYLGQAKGAKVRHDAMFFVSGTTIRKSRDNPAVP